MATSRRERGPALSTEFPNRGVFQPADISFRTCNLYSMTHISETPQAPQASNEPLDLLIVGAGIAGVDMAHHVVNEFPGWNWTMIDSNDDIGGTWNTFHLPRHPD